MADLPSHLEGRGSFGGPVRGAYLRIASYYLASMANNDDVTVTFAAPVDCRIACVAISCGAITSDPVYTVINGTDDVIADTTLPDDTTSVVTGSSLANRDLNKADQFTIQCIADAGDAVAAPGVQIDVYAWTKNHPTDDKADD